MDWFFKGLPIHVQLVHFVVVVVPLAALALVPSSFRPTARRRLGVVTPLIALGALVSVPNATESGEALEEQVNETALSELHAHLGEDLLPWVIALFTVALIQWAWRTFLTGSGQFANRLTSPILRTVIKIAVLVATVVVVVGSVVVVVIIGESGARAAWDARIG